MSKKLSQDEFIKHYLAAQKLKWTRQQLAEYLGTAVGTIKRRSLTVRRETGIPLKILPDIENSTLNDSDVQDLEDELLQINENSGKNREIFHQIVSNKDKNQYIPGVDVITSAQNSTPIHERFFSTILKYCEERSATFMVIPYRYKNPTSVFTDDNYDFWAPKLTPYLVNETVRLAPNLVIAADLKIQPTAVEPLSGLDGYVGENSAVFGCPKIQFKTIPTPSQTLPKILTTTGAITLPNYTDSKAGFKGRFHYSMAALIVEVDEDGVFHIRHIHGKDDGSFYDLDRHYTVRGSTGEHRVAALITGDSHVMFIDDDVVNATYADEDSICAVLNPEMKVFHDLTDGWVRNHHHRGNDLIAFAKHHYDMNNVEAELQMSADFIDTYNSPKSLNVIVKSNHDEVIDRWLMREGEPKVDPENARFYYYMKYAQLANMEETENGYRTIDPFKFWCEHPDQERGLECLDNTKFLKRDESLMISGIEVGFHGDQGPNGARGSAKGFANIGPKCIIGHAHSPSITESVYRIGTSSKLKLEYTSGPSSWMHTHCIIYPDGSRTLINIVKGRWKL